MDMEQGVLGQIASSPNIGHLFDQDSYISSNSGSGNNWGQGYSEYGAEFRDAILESVRRQAEDCDVLDSFFLLSSLGGGTGSGLGSFITQLLAEEFADVWKFNCCIQPSEKDDSEVIVSPYNSVLSLSKLINYSDCVLAVENQALYDIFAAVEARRTKEVCSNATVSKLLYDGRKRFTSICDNTGRGVGVKSKTKYSQKRSFYDIHIFL